MLRKPTALVNEAFLRLAGSSQTWANRHHFYTSASEAMRRILIARNRKQNRPKHGGGVNHVEFDDSASSSPVANDRILQVHKALDALEAEDEIQPQAVKFRVFVGLEHREVAELLGFSERTVRRRWEVAKVWIYQRITAEPV